MKKYCIFSANYLPNIGGIERFTYYLSRELSKRGNHVTIVTSNLFGLKEYEILDDNIDIYRIPVFSLLGGRYPVPKKNKDYRTIYRNLKENEYDFIIINARFYFHSVDAAKFAYKNGIPSMTMEHGSSHLSVNNRILDYFGGIFEHCLTSVLKRYCKNYYGISKTACEWSRHFGIESRGTVYNSVDFEEIEKMLQDFKIDYRKEYGIKEDSLVVSFTGRLLPEKGVNELLVAFKEIADDNVYLIFAGDGPEMQQLSKNKNKNVILLGKIDFEKVVCLLSVSDIFCLPSVSEGFSTSLLEAAATKTPIISTDTGGARELMPDDSYGLVIPDNSVYEIKKALLKMIGDTDYRNQSSNNCYQRLIENFSWESTANAVEKIADSI